MRIPLLRGIPFPFHSRRQTDPPLIFENLLRVIALNDVHQARLKHDSCDLYINPPVERFGLLEFQSYEQIINVGYNTAQKVITANLDNLCWIHTAPSHPTAPLVNQLEQVLSDLESVLATHKA